jgi:hypothetical protein
MAFNPMSVADALDVLRTELEKELSGPDARVAVSGLRHEIRHVIAQASAWAIENGSHFDFVDPPADCDAIHCILMLRRLSYDLRRLASRHGMQVMNDNASAREGKSESLARIEEPRSVRPENEQD